MITPLSAPIRSGPRPFVLLRTAPRKFALFLGRLALRLIHPFRQIPFKIALAYTLTTLCTVVAVELLAAGAAGWMLFGTETVPEAYAGRVTRSAGSLSSALIRQNRQALEGRLSSANTEIDADFVLLQLATPRRHSQISAVADANGQVIACAPGAPFQLGRSLTDQLTANDALLIRTAAALPAGRTGMARRDGDGGVIAAAPIFSADGKRVGLLAVRASGGPRPEDLGTVTWLLVLLTAPPILLLGGTAGLVFGTAVTRPLTRRLKLLSGAACAWGRGDFAVTIKDRSGDEIGELGRRLSAMSAELQRHIQAQQKLAALEERNRLARDLHDTVKQQAFAAAMQLGAARTVLAGDGGPAGVFVLQAEKLINKVQEDLMALIHELRPLPLKSGAGTVIAADTDLPALLRQEALDWSQSSGIPADISGASSLDVPEDVCQALLRIALEALANAARHSGASQVEISLREDSDGMLQMTLRDNGKGFDPVFTPRGMGLYSMRDRALSLPAGQFSLETAPDAGVTVRVSCAGRALPNVS